MSKRVSPIYRGLLQHGEVVYFYFLLRPDGRVQPFGLIFESEEEESRYSSSDPGYEDAPIPWDLLAEIQEAEILTEVMEEAEQE